MFYTFFPHFANTLASTHTPWFGPILVQRRLIVLLTYYSPCCLDPLGSVGREVHPFWSTLVHDLLHNLLKVDIEN